MHKLQPGTALGHLVRGPAGEGPGPAGMYGGFSPGGSPRAARGRYRGRGKLGEDRKPGSAATSALAVVALVFMAWRFYLDRQSTAAVLGSAAGVHAKDKLVVPSPPPQREMPCLDFDKNCPKMAAAGRCEEDAIFLMGVFDGKGGMMKPGRCSRSCGACVPSKEQLEWEEKRREEKKREAEEFEHLLGKGDGGGGEDQRQAAGLAGGMRYDIV